MLSCGQPQKHCNLGQVVIAPTAIAYLDVEGNLGMPAACPGCGSCCIAVSRCIKVLSHV